MPIPLRSVRGLVSSLASRAWYLGIAVLATGCASAVAPAAGTSAVDAGDACRSTLTCFAVGRGTITFAIQKACRVNSDCVAVSFPADRFGTREILGVSVSSASEFERATSGCGASGGPPPEPTFFEDDAGTVASGDDAGIVAECRAGCCVAVPSGP